MSESINHHVWMFGVKQSFSDNVRIFQLLIREIDTYNVIEY